MAKRSTICGNGVGLKLKLDSQLAVKLSRRTLLVTRSDYDAGATLNFSNVSRCLRKRSAHAFYLIKRLYRGFRVSSAQKFNQKSRRTPPCRVKSRQEYHVNLFNKAHMKNYGARLSMNVHGHEVARLSRFREMDKGPWAAFPRKFIWTLASRFEAAPAVPRSIQRPRDKQWVPRNRVAFRAALPSLESNSCFLNLYSVLPSCRPGGAIILRLKWRITK